MSCFSGVLEEEFFDEDEDFSGPVEKRRKTDFGFVIGKIIFLFGLFGILIYCMIYGDMFRMFHGYDDCGNVCGRNNPTIPGMGSCVGGDFTNKKFLKLSSYDVLHDTYVGRECVQSCPKGKEYLQIFYICIVEGSSGYYPRDKRSIYIQDDYSDMDVDVKKTNNNDLTFEKAVEDLANSWHAFIYLSLLALCLSGFFMVMTRYAAAFMVWSSLYTIVGLLSGITFYLWLMYAQASDPVSSKSLLIFAIAFTVTSVIVLLVIVVLRRRIRLVIQLFEEAGRALSAMPLLFLQPIWTFLSLVILFSMWLYCFVLIESAGKLSKVEGLLNVYDYRKDVVMKLASWYNAIAGIWLSQFVIACQHMVLASAVSTWFFARDKSLLSSPILTGYNNLIRYHLGSVIFGSLIMTIVSIIKSIVKSVERLFQRSNNFILRIVSLCLRCLMRYVERFFNMFTRNAYVEIAIYGRPFCSSAIRGLKILFHNLFNVLAVNSIGDYILFMFKVIITLINCTISAVIFTNDDRINEPYLPIMICLIFSFFIAHTFISIFEMIINTIFICFCEDCQMNDGINKPFYMSRGLMEFVENSKKALMKNAIANENNPNIISSPPVIYKFRSS